MASYCLSSYEKWSGKHFQLPTRPHYTPCRSPIANELPMNCLRWITIVQLWDYPKQIQKWSHPHKTTTDLTLVDQLLIIVGLSTALRKWSRPSWTNTDLTLYFILVEQLLIIAVEISIAMQNWSHTCWTAIDLNLVEKLLISHLLTSY